MAADDRGDRGRPPIHVHLNTDIGQIDGFVGNFKTTLSTNGEASELTHGVAVIATGGRPYEPTEYSYGQDPADAHQPGAGPQIHRRRSGVDRLNAAVFIQCVGSREPERPYCSRVCCTHSVENALELKRRNPDMNVFILYRDIRTYGEREYLYKEAREKGVIFIRYSLDQQAPGGADRRTGCR